MIRIHSLLASLFVLLALGWASSASAQIVAPYSFGAGTLGWPINFYQQETIPYYALHPPVYYSVPVPRTYGWSPFAYPPGTMTPEVAMPEVSAQSIYYNPFVPQGSDEKKGVHKAPSDRAASYRRMHTIFNPHVEDSQLSALGE